MIDRIETAIRAQHVNWKTLFRRHGNAWQCVLFPKLRLTEQDYQTLVRRLSAPEHARGLPVSAKTRAKLRAIANKSDSGERLYG
ncbi:hypothetical protein Q4494_00880 [Celeribacter halophilus]|jgi:predicted RecB family endonuclease|uniref:Uncharacterized protein n=1 Tax=Celeribacter halophilus TaxID=576117 RepID=A0AAW7XRA1_9RHOB|nr:hypothetical protein [Celeribacter halophilus]MDO6455617.1 hypothetical protein [Celeribacter halophilus]